MNKSKRTVKRVTLEGRTIFLRHGKIRALIMESAFHGSRVRVTVFRQDWNKREHRYDNIGTFEGVGGFKDPKDFDYEIAERAAIEVAVAKGNETWAEAEG